MGELVLYIRVPLGVRFIRGGGRNIRVVEGLKV